MNVLATHLWRAFALTLLCSATLKAQTINLKEYLPYTDGSTSTLDSESGLSVTFAGAANDLLIWQAVGAEEDLQFIFMLNDTGLLLLNELGVAPNGGSVISTETYRPAWMVVPPEIEIGQANPSSGTYEGTEAGETPWSGSATATLTAGAQETITTPVGTYDAIPLTFVSQWNDGNAFYSASGTTTQTWWVAKGEGVVKFRYEFEETVVDEGELEMESGDFEFLLASNNIIPGPDTGPDPEPLPPTAIVDIPDLQLKRALLRALERSDTDLAAAQITVGEMRSLERFTANALIADLTGLETATNLIDLNLDIRGVVGNVTDLTPIQGLTKLVHLRFAGNQVEDLSPIANLTNLVSLRFSKNNVSDISALSRMSDLNLLWMESNEIEDLSPISGLGRLQFLAASSNQISDISPLSPLIRIGELSLNFNEISDISPLEPLKSLSKLSLQGNRISDVSPLAAHQFVKTIGIGDNEITDISPLADFPRLTFAGVHLNFLDITPGSRDRTVIDAWIARGVGVGFEPQKEGTPGEEAPFHIRIFREGTELRLEWPSEAQASYSVHISTDLNAWLPAQEAPITGTGALLSHRVPISMDAKQFYSVVRN